MAAETPDPTLPPAPPPAPPVPDGTLTRGLTSASTDPDHVPWGRALPGGTRVGDYTIQAPLAAGGMGVVYIAQQAQPQRTVALKLVRPGLASARMLRRFELEAETLGRLQHPGIAQIYEAGTFDLGEGPQPFFAMEFVVGVPLTQYAKTKGLGTRERLELAAKIADAVQHAHQRGVVHRDLKPSNILVTDEGQPKILDFGVARLTDSDTSATTLNTDIGQLVGTLPYMSPEQASGDPAQIDTRSDVYALGVVIYELLVDRLPHDVAKKMMVEAARIIREEEPTRLSSLNTSLRGDVETIVGHALEKDKERRYQSASALAADIRRYLSDEPISARPASTWYQFRKFARRNRTLVGGVLATLVVLAGGLIATTVYAARERDARADADAQLLITEREQRRAEEAVSFIVEALKTADATRGGKKDATIADAMSKASALLDSGRFKDDPDIETSQRDIIAAVLMNMGAEADAEVQFMKALDAARRVQPLNERTLSTALNNLAICRRRMKGPAAAEPLYVEALDILRRITPGDAPDLANTLNNLAFARMLLGRESEAEPMMLESLEMRRRLALGDDPKVAESLNNIATLWERQGRLAEAEPAFREALAMRERLYPQGSFDVATSLSNLGTHLAKAGRPREATPLYDRALNIQRALLPAEHPAVLSTMSSIAVIDQLTGNFDAAARTLEEVYEARKRTLGPEHPDLVYDLHRLGYGRLLTDQPLEAERLFVEALALLERKVPGDHPLKADLLTSIALAYLELDRQTDAQAAIGDAVAMARRIEPGGGLASAAALNTMARCALESGRHDEAETTAREAVALYERFVPRGSGRRATALITLARVLHAQRDHFAAKYAEAQSLVTQAVDMVLRSEPPEGANARQILKFMNEIAP